MWARVWMALTISGAYSQTTHTKIQQNGVGYEWGWQLTPQGDGTAGHYYVKLPQNEQEVRYVADDTGYHGAVSVNTGVHTASIAIGERALQFSNTQLPLTTQLYQVSSDNQTQAPNSAQPVEIYLLQQQFSSGDQSQFPQTNVQYTIPNYYYNNNVATPVQYNIQTLHPIQLNEQISDKATNFETKQSAESSKPLQTEEDNAEQDYEHLTTDVVQVFKDHNCTDEAKKEQDDNLQKPTRVYAESPTYDIHNINGNYGIRSTERPLSYRGAVHFKVEAPRGNARSERYYYNEGASTTVRSVRTEDERISRLVASTQDLISNEDLLKINHAAEKQTNTHNDDIIKPKPRFSLKAEQTRYDHYSTVPTSTPRNRNTEQTRYDHYSTVEPNTQRNRITEQTRYDHYSTLEPNTQRNRITEQTRYDHYSTVEPNTQRNRITVRAKIQNIVDSEIEHLENNQKKEDVLKTNADQYKFASPIVVQDSNYDNFKDQIVNNLVSTMVPYLQDGYEIVGVRNSIDENLTNSDDNQSSSDNLVNVTPRPLSQKYLAPITVALRLFNANESGTFNTVDDHEVSDSEVVTDTVKSPHKEKTVVEIQQSIPVSITHINDVEVHEYLDEGRSNDRGGPLDLAKSLYHTYVDALRGKDSYGQKNTRNNANSISDQQNDSREHLEPSENIQTEVEIRPNDGSNERNEYARPYYNTYSVDQEHPIIQPIIIEKEVPVTKFVDRFIEKEVPYPEKVEVVKHVPVDRPVAVPVPYETFVDRPVEVTRFVNKPYPVEVPHLYPVRVPYPVEHKVYVDRPVHVPYPVEKIVEKQIVHQVPVPTPVAVPVEVPVEQKVLYPIPIEHRVPYPVDVEKPVTVEKIVHKEVRVPYEVEKPVPYPVHYETKVPVPYPVEKRIPYPVDRVVEKPVTVTKYVEKPVHIGVPVPQPVPVHVPQPYPVERVVEKRVPYPVHVDRFVEKKVPVPYPVEKVVEKFVEKPVVVTKYVDKPYPVEKRVPYPVEKIVEKKVPYPVQVPVHVKVPYPVEKEVERPVYVPFRVPYRFEKSQDYYNYGYTHGAEQSQNVPRYQKFAEQRKQAGPAPLNLKEVQHNFDQKSQQSYAAQYNQYVKELKDRKPAVQTTHWGNLYASSYQYINNTPKFEVQKSPALSNYIHYLTNNNNQNDYYGPPPMVRNEHHWEQQNKNYFTPNAEQLKLRRTDRTPKVSSLRIEYGFKPPLIPSTEIDLDGVPIKKD